MNSKDYKFYNRFVLKHDVRGLHPTNAWESGWQGKKHWKEHVEKTKVFEFFLKLYLKYNLNKLFFGKKIF